MLCWVGQAPWWLNVMTQVAGDGSRLADSSWFSPEADSLQTLHMREPWQARDQSSRSPNVRVAAAVRGQQRGCPGDRGHRPGAGAPRGPGLLPPGPVPVRSDTVETPLYHQPRGRAGRSVLGGRRWSLEATKSTRARPGRSAGQRTRQQQDGRVPAPTRPESQGSFKNAPKTRVETRATLPRCHCLQLLDVRG